LIAIYLTEFAPRRVAAPIQLVLDVLNGVPTIVTGIFVYGLLVIGHLQSAYAAAFALAIVMLPLVARAAQEVLLLVPSALREGSLVLGVSRWRTVLGGILPTTLRSRSSWRLSRSLKSARRQCRPIAMSCSTFGDWVSRTGARRRSAA